MADKFQGVKLDWSMPHDFAEAVLDTDLKAAGSWPRAIYVGGLGNLVVTNAAGDAITILAIPAGTTIPIRPVSIVTVGTTATGILMLL